MGVLIVQNIDITAQAKSPRRIQTDGGGRSVVTLEVAAARLPAVPALEPPLPPVGLLASRSASLIDEMADVRSSSLPSARTCHCLRA